jgi:hypothetical protein
MQFTPQICLGLFMCVLSLSAAEPSSPAPFLQVDFGTKSSPVQSKFVAAKAGVGQVKGPLVYEFEGYDKKTAAAGLIAVTVAGGGTIDSIDSLCAREREDAPFSTRSRQDDVYRDFIAGPSIMTVGISGLNPNRVYEVAFYAFDKVRAQTMKIEDFTSGVRGKAEAAISYSEKTSAADADAGALCVTLRTKVPASGSITFRITSVGGGSAVINGLELSTR